MDRPACQIECRPGLTAISRLAKKKEKEKSAGLMARGSADGEGR